MEGLGEDGGEGMEMSDRVTQLIKGDPPGLIIQIDPEFMAGRLVEKWNTYTFMHLIILIMVTPLQTPGIFIIPNI
ncbi:unnamed protein product [Staurois parvus]|uniref:Uncharacterized protein n=1 Tax=Staurois parvus TaxID=386267 RepID=A0ABN9CBN4_9NEOB|nr:unnamed protein product [Staurois parvus]